MQVNIQEFLQECGLDEQLYPGKRVVKKLPQPGEHKSHCAIFDWRSSELLRVDIKAGLHGKALEPKELRKFPVSFQSPTYLEIATNLVANDDSDETEEDEEEEGKSKGGGGKGRAPKKRPELRSLSSFAKIVEGKIPDLGEVKKLVVMGKQIAKEAMGSVLGMLAAQIKAMTVTPVNIVAAAQAVKVSVAQPGGGLRPMGHETVAYKYKGGDMFGIEAPAPKR